MGERYTISNIQGFCGIEKEIISFLQFEMWIAFSVLVNEPKSCQSLENKNFFERLNQILVTFDILLFLSFRHYNLNTILPGS